MPVRRLSRWRLCCLNDGKVTEGEMFVTRYLTERNAVV
jgi:hypothetical protein